MLKSLVASASIALAIAVTPVQAQQVPSPDSPPSAVEVDPALVGLPVYSSDDHKLGQITQVGTSAGGHAVRAELDAFLGIGSTSVVIDGDVFQKKPDRIELMGTAAQVKGTIAKQQQRQAQ